jgi:phosphatidylinositol alpha-mannosyltransferase
MPYFQRLDGRIAVSKPAMDFVGQYLPGEYVIIPNGLEVEDFTGPNIQPFSQFKDGKINLLFFSRLEKRKGLRYLLAAYSRLKWKYPQLRLIVAGHGKPDADSLHIIGERALTDVIFTGSVSEQEKARYFRTADIYCAPNTGGESFGIVLLEAMAAGTPIVASAIEGFSGVITHGRDGLLVPPKVDDALATAIETLIKAPSLRNAMVQAGRETVEKYRWSRVAVRVLEFYQSVREIRARSGMTYRRPVHRII